MSPEGGLWNVWGKRMFPGVSFSFNSRRRKRKQHSREGCFVYLPLCPPRFKIMSDKPSPERIAHSVTVIQQNGFCWILLITWFLSDSTLLQNEYRMKVGGRGDTNNILGCCIFIFQLKWILMGLWSSKHVFLWYGSHFSKLKHIELNFLKEIIYRFQLMVGHLWTLSP